MAGASAYCASKFAVRGLTQSLAQELRPHRITVNSYAPGFIRTPMSMPFLAESSPASDSGDEQHDGHGEGVKELLGMTKDVPIAEPAVIAELVAYLIKPEAYFVTGQCLSIDGGLHFD